MASCVVYKESQVRNVFPQILYCTYMQQRLQMLTSNLIHISVMLRRAFQLILIHHWSFYFFALNCFSGSWANANGS